MDEIKGRGAPLGRFFDGFRHGSFVISNGGFMRKLSRGVLFFSLNREKSGTAG